jgi:hypothetical protein
MATKNRVDPWGRPFETKERGYLMGNRDFGDAWIACSLRHPDGSTGPSSVEYFKLFFLDEPTALAAGHRPRAQCRRKDYELYKRMFGASSYTEMDRVLRSECIALTNCEQRSMRAAELLPPGAMFAVDDRAYLAWQRVAYLWSPGGYTAAGLTKDFGKVLVLTPPSTEKVLDAGYRPWVHPSVMRP